MNLEGILLSIGISLKKFFTLPLFSDSFSIVERGGPPHAGRTCAARLHVSVVGVKRFHHGVDFRAYYCQTILSCVFHVDNKLVLWSVWWYDDTLSLRLIRTQIRIGQPAFLNGNLQVYFSLEKFLFVFLLCLTVHLVEFLIYHRWCSLPHLYMAPPRAHAVWMTWPSCHHWTPCQRKYCPGESMVRVQKGLSWSAPDPPTTNATI